MRPQLLKCQLDLFHFKANLLFFFVWFFFFSYDLLAFQGRVVCFSCVMLILVNHAELLYLDFSTKSSENTPQQSKSNYGDSEGGLVY